MIPPELSAHRSILTRRTVLRGGAMAGGTLAGSLTALPFGSRAWAQAQGQPRDKWPETARLIDEYVGSKRVANMVAALGWKQDAPVYITKGTLGFESTRPAGPDTLYRIYSMTKPLTGMAAMILIDAGKMQLDQPLAEIIPAFADMQVQKRPDGAITADNLEPAARPITIRHMLTHTAGFAYSIIQQGPIAQAYVQNGLVPVAVSRLQAIPGFSGTKAPSLAAFAERLARLPLVYQPGTKWSYSVALDLMGRVIEVVSGQKFDAFLRERIIDPCGMASTWFTVPRSEAARLSTSYYDLAGFPVPIDTATNSVFFDPPAFPFGGAGLVSTARDYDRFLQMLAGYGSIDGKRVMSEAAVRLGTSDLLPDTLRPGGGFREGFGFGAAGLVGKGIAEGLYGWFGAASTAGLVNLKYSLRQTLMTQLLTGQQSDLETRFPTAVARDALEALLPAG